MEKKIKLGHVKGRGKKREFQQVWNCNLQQNCVNHKYYQKNDIYMVFIFYLHTYIHILQLQGMKVIFSMLFKRFTFKDKNLAEYMTNLTETLKVFGPAMFLGLAFFHFRNSWHLMVPWRHQALSGVVVRGLSRESRGPMPFLTLVYTALLQF